MTRWQNTDAPRGDDYDARWRSMAAKGESIHGEADLVTALLDEYTPQGGRRILDAGCGTGRVAIELARRGYSVVGVDADPRMLATAHAKAPELTWVEADLAYLTTRINTQFDVAVLAGNVMIFLTPGTEARVLAELSGRVVPGGLLVAGFQIRRDRISLGQYEQYAEAAGFEPLARWATWDRVPYRGGDYAVSVHTRS